MNEEGPGTVKDGGAALGLDGPLGAGRNLLDEDTAGPDPQIK